MPVTEVNGISIYYEVYGEGEPVVLIGGLGSQVQSWATQIPIYSKFFKVIGFDNRGAGRSDKPEPGYSLEDMADDTVSLLDHLEIDKASFVGKSMGGMIAQWIGIKYPHRTNKLVMGCCSASRDEVGNMILQIGREIASKVGMKTVWLMALFMGYNRSYIKENFQGIKDSLSNIEEDPDALRGYIGQSIACEGHDTLELLTEIKAQTLVVYGEADNITSPVGSRKLAELIENSTAHEFKDVGHGFWREKQAEVDRLVLEFIKN